MQVNPFISTQLCGVQINPLSKPELLNAIDSAMASGIRNGIIGNHNLHSLYLVQRNQAMQEFYSQALLTHVDGMSLVLLGRALGLPIGREQRTGYLDWFEDFLLLAQKRKWRIYFLGGRPEVAAKIAPRLSACFPELRLMCHHGYDAFGSDTRVYDEIESFRPHIILVGMGMTLQEKWILEARKKVETGLFFQCGAIMDYLVGEQRPAPRWLGQLGFEWLFRLATRPRSLAFRYLIEPLLLSPRIFGEIVRRGVGLELK